MILSIPPNENEPLKNVVVTYNVLLMIEKEKSIPDDMLYPANVSMIFVNIAIDVFGGVYIQYDMKLLSLTFMIFWYNKFQHGYCASIASCFMEVGIIVSLMSKTLYSHCRINATSPGSVETMNDVGFSSLPYSNPPAPW